MTCDRGDCGAVTMRGWIRKRWPGIVATIVVAAVIGAIGVALYSIPDLSDKYLCRYECPNCGPDICPGGLFGTARPCPRRCWVTKGKRLTHCCNCGFPLEPNK